MKEAEGDLGLDSGRAGGVFLLEELLAGASGDVDLGPNGKVAMVAAASQGLGFEVARALTREGARVSIVSRDGQAIQQAARRIEQETGTATTKWPGQAYQWNVSKETP